MTVIDIRDWGEFQIGDLFDVSRPAARVKLGYLEGDTPFVSTSSSNNGVSEWVDPGDEVLEPGDCITVSALDGIAFWQPQDFLGRGGAGSSISILRRKGLSELVGLFIASAITAACHANYSLMLSGTMLRSVVLRLPVTSSDDPDWDHMEQIMREVISRQEHDLDKLISLLRTSSKVIETDMWAEFQISDLFNVVKGSRLRSLDRVEGDIPYIGASLFNNGYTHRIGNDERIHPGNVLTTAYNGTVPGKTFYQPIPFWATDDVNVLYPKFEMTVESGLFIAPLIEVVGRNYVYVDKWKLQDMIDAVILLPATSEGNPDWGYMERTMRKTIAERETALDSLQSLVPEV